MAATRIFYRYRPWFSHGFGQWEYRDALLNSETKWEEFVQGEKENLAKDCDWSDHYRGVEIERVDTPPLKWLKTQAHWSKVRAEGLLAREAEFRELIVKLETGDVSSSR